MKRDNLERALEKAAQIMAGTVTCVGYERDLAIALIKLWQEHGQQSARPEALRTQKLPSLPDEIQEWCWHMDLHLTEHDERHAAMALRAAWPHVSAWLKANVGPSAKAGAPFVESPQLFSGDGMSAGRFHCACVFSRPTDFSEAVLVSECAFHSARSVERRVLKEVSDDLHIHGHGLAVARVERMIHLLPLARSQEKPDA